MKQIINFFFILFGSLLISYIFYIRLILERLPRNLNTNLYVNGSYLQISIYIYLFLLSLFFLIYNIKKLIIIEKKINFMILKHIKTAVQTVTSIINKSLEEFYLWIVNNTVLEKYLYKIIKNLGLFFYTHFLKKPIILLFILNIVPKTLFLICFFIDVFILKQFCYIYKASFLLLFPLLERFLFYNFAVFCDQNISGMDTEVSIFDEKTKKEITATECISSIASAPEYLKKNRFIFLPKNDNDKRTVEYFMSIFIIDLLPVKIFQVVYMECSNKYLAYFNICLYFIYAIIWAFLLYYGF